MKVVVASQSPVKLQAAKQGFEAYFGSGIEYISIDAPSNVSSQPIGNEQTIQGAQNRVKYAYHTINDADYWVGIEGGLEKVGSEYEVFAWIVIKSKTKVSRGKTGTFVLPKAVAELIDQGKELGDADDIVFGMKDSKKSIGAVGILTQGKISRASYYTDAVKLALIPFVNEEYYD